MTEHGAAPPTLGTPTAGGMAAPILEIPSLQELRNQPKKPSVMQLLTQDREHHRMI
jgi:hypothetical protein